MNTNNVAFVIPVKTEHLILAEKFYESAIKHKINADFYFVLNFIGDMYCFKLSKNNVILIEDYYSGGIITKKKWYGLQQVYKKYKYVICCDSENRIFKHVDIESVCDEFYAQKNIFSSTLNKSKIGGFCVEINKFCSKLFSDEDITKLQTITKDFREYFWNNHLPIYSSEYVIEFFNYIRWVIGPDQNYNDISWEHFDYIIYVYWLLLKKDWKLTYLNHSFDSSYNERLSDMPLETAKELIRITKPHQIPMCYMNEQTNNTTRDLEKESESVFMIYDVREAGYEYSRN